MDSSSTNVKDLVTLSTRYRTGNRRDEDFIIARTSFPQLSSSISSLIASIQQRLNRS